MRYYFAPMEGITLYPLRNVHKEMFGNGGDKYYTPFVTARIGKRKTYCPKTIGHLQITEKRFRCR